MRKYLALLPVAFVLMSSGCSKKPVATTTESGLTYTIYSDGKGEKPDSGDYVYVMYRGHLDSAGKPGALFDASYDRNQPIIYRLGVDKLIKGWQEGVPMLAKGDSASFVIPPDLAYGETGRDKIPANSTLRFEIKLEDFDEPDFGVPFAIPAGDTITDPSGIKYAFIRKTNWQAAQPGNVVAMHYKGYFLNGEVFDESISKGRPFTFKLGQGGVIKGWDIVAAKMNVGDKVRVIIPPDLAYGPNDFSSIPGGSTLVFDIIMIGAYEQQ